jgi:hypothetical protein
MAPRQIGWAYDDVPEHILMPVARAIANASGGWGTWTVVVSPEHHAHLDRAGWSKADVRQFLFDHSTRTVADIKRNGWAPGPITPEDETKETRPLQSPDQILLTMGGGGAGQFTIVIPAWGGSGLSNPVTKKIRA